MGFGLSDKHTLDHGLESEIHIFWTNESQVAPQAKLPSYIDPLTVKLSFRSELLVNDFHSVFNFCVNHMLCCPVRKMFQRNLRLSDLFLSLVPPVWTYCYFRRAEKLFPENTYTQQRNCDTTCVAVFFVSCFVQVSQCIFLRGDPRRRPWRRDDATRQIWNYLDPLPSHPGTEYLVRDPLT